jgi:uncharacterized protein YkwD
MKVITVLFIMIILSGTVHATEPTDTFRIKTLDISYLEFLTVVEINKHRVYNGRQPVKWNDSLSVECRKYSQFLKDEDKFAHLAPDSHYYGENINNTGYNGANTYEENAKTIVRNWINSPGHNRILLLRDGKTGGVGIVLEGGFGNGIINTYRVLR